MNRGYDTHGKVSRRIRLWLTPETWARIDERARELAWSDRRDQVVIERTLESTYGPERSNRANRPIGQSGQSSSSSTGPDELPYYVNGVGGVPHPSDD